MEEFSVDNSKDEVADILNISSTPKKDLQNEFMGPVNIDTDQKKHQKRDRLIVITC